MIVWETDSMQHLHRVYSTNSRFAIQDFAWMLSLFAQLKSLHNIESCRSREKACDLSAVAAADVRDGLVFGDTWTWIEGDYNSCHLKVSCCCTTTTTTTATMTIVNQVYSQHSSRCRQGDVEVGGEVRFCEACALKSKVDIDGSTQREPSRA